MANRQSISDFEVMYFELKPLRPIQLGLADLYLFSSATSWRISFFLLFSRMPSAVLLLYNLYLFVFRLLLHIFCKGNVFQPKSKIYFHLLFRIKILITY